MRVVIIGNGVAGTTCALQIRARDVAARITLVSPESPYFFSRTALMYAWMGRLQRKDLEPYERHSWEEKGIQRIQDTAMDHHHPEREIRLASGKVLTYDRLVLALGSRAFAPPWEGLGAVRSGLVHLVTLGDLDACEALTPSTRQAVVVGGGLIGVEMVECLRHHRIPTTFLVREPWYWPLALAREEADRVGQHLEKHGVDLRLGEEVDRVDVDEGGRVRSVQTRAGEGISCQFLGVAAGVRPFLQGMEGWRDRPETGRGIRVDVHLQTSLRDVFACGDCAEIERPGRPSLVELLWYGAKRQGLQVAENLLGGGHPYAPPTFFNSSRFFDLDFTTVGEVMTLPDGTPSWFLSFPDREACGRIVHDGQRVKGFNFLGSRWDHTVLCRWIEEERSPDWVLDHLKEGQFDGEFSRLPIEHARREPLPLMKEPRP